MGGFLLRRLMRRSGTAASAQETSRTIRSTEAKFIDLTDELSSFHDSNDIAVSVTSPSATLSACIWLGRTLTHGTSATLVKRELLDHFWIETAAATNGQEAGSITLEGYSGAGETGTYVTRTVAIDCDDSVPTTWNMGARTLARNGGIPLHSHFPGAASGLTISSQTNAGQFEILSDGTNGLYRLVLAGTYGSATRTVTPVAGNSATVTLSNAHAYVVTFVADQFDIAPWPATDAYTGGETGNQFMRACNAANKVRGGVIVCEDGDYDPGNTGFTTYFRNGGTGATVSALPSTNKPTAPFTGNSQTYDPDPVQGVDDGWFTIKGRTPLGARFHTVAMDFRYLDRSTDPEMGVRLHNLELSSFTFGNGGVSPSLNMLMVDHCFVTGGAGAVNTSGAGLNTNTLANADKHVTLMANLFTGKVSIFGLDHKVIGNRFSTNQHASGQSNADALNYVIMDSGSDYGEIAFNLFINKKGALDPLHQDIMQQVWSATSLASAGSNRVAREYGNIIWRGDGYTATAGDVSGGYSGSAGDKLSGGQCMFGDNRTAGHYMLARIACNIMVELSAHGITRGGLGAGTRISRNVMLYDVSTSASPPGPSGNPYIRFVGTSDGSSDVVISKNITAGTSLFTTGSSGYAHTSTGNVFGATASDGWDPTSYMVNPFAGSGARDVGEIVAALQYLPGQETDAGPFYEGENALVDYRRQTLPQGFAALIA